MKIIALLTLLIMLPVVFAGLSGPSPIPTPPNFYISSSAISLCKGRVNYVPITVTNRGALGNPQMQNILLNWAVSRGLSAVGNATVNAGTINTNSSKTVYMPILVNSNASSFVSVGVAINYYYYYLYSDSETRNMSFSVYACPSPLSITVSPNVITAGGAQSLRFNLTNNGNTSLDSVSLSFSVPSQDITLLGGQPQLIGSIPPMSSVQITESVYVSRNASQLFPFNVSGTFYNGSNLNLISNNLFLMFGGVINLTSSSLTISPQVPTPGSIFSISFILTNVGTSRASAVTATVIPPKGFTPFGSNPAFVGDIGVDSQAPVTLSVMAGNSIKSGTYNVPVRINYLDNLRYNESRWVNVSVSVGQASFNASQIARARSSSGAGSAVIVIVLVVVIIVLSVLLIRERRRSK